jgi:dolichol-phosphate mannosyltransferase
MVFRPERGRLAAGGRFRGDHRTDDDAMNGKNTTAAPHPERSSDTLIFLPTYNERETIAPMVDALLALPARCDVLVVDDQSTDGTTELLESKAAAERRFGLIVRPRKLGVGSAHKLGWLYARRRGYRRLVTLDADFSHDPADVPRLLTALDQGADVAIGSRFAPGGRLDYRGWRLFLSRSANYLARTVLRLPIAEYTTSLRAARLDRVPEGLVETIDNDGYGFFLICAVRFVRTGLRVAEVPIHFRDRDHGTSKIPRLEIVRGALNLARLAVDRKAGGKGVQSLGTEHVCPQCGQACRLPTLTGGMRCLACSYQG